MNAPPPADAITTTEFDKTKLNAAQKEMRRIAHHTLAKVTDDIGRRRSFNTAVAAVMELLNAIGKFDSTTLAGRVVAHEALEIAVMCLSPMIPHVTHELWRELGHEQALAHERWWAPDPDALVQDAIEISVQVNGKMRARVSDSGRCDAGGGGRGRARGRERAEVRRGQADQEGDLREGQTGQHRRMKGLLQLRSSLGTVAALQRSCGFHLQGRQPLPRAVRVHLHRHQGRADRLRAGPAQGADRIEGRR